MSRLIAFVLLTLALAVAGLACAGDNDGDAQTGATPNAADGAPADGRQAATPIDATPAVAAPDQEAYRATVAGLGTVQETCTYMVEVSAVDCTERGIYKLEPPPADASASCVVGLSGGSKPEYILCSGPAGGERKFFVIPP
jgi:hypothetical protein